MQRCTLKFRQKITFVLYWRIKRACFVLKANIIGGSRGVIWGMSPMENRGGRPLPKENPGTFPNTPQGTILVFSPYKIIVRFLYLYSIFDSLGFQQTWIKTCLVSSGVPVHSQIIEASVLSFIWSRAEPKAWHIK